MSKFATEFRKFLDESKFMFIIYAPVVVLLLALLFLEIHFNIPDYMFTRDPAAIANLPFYAGWVSSLGAVLWAAAASIALFTSRMCNGESKRYLITMGLFISWLLIDDLFMMHDGLLPLFGISERIVYLVYAFIIILIIKYNGKFLMKQNYWILLTAAFFLACSIVIDVKLGQYLPYEHIFEDGFKLLGIAGIFGHIIGVCSKIVPKPKKG